MVETDWTPGGVEGCGYANIVICTESSESLSWGITTALTIHFNARRCAVVVYLHDAVCYLEAPTRFEILTLRRLST
jgi:hypothetical protein